MKIISILFLICSSSLIFAQSFITKDIKSFGAKGNGKTNDHAAFKKAEDYFNKRGGYGKLVISKGTYLVGDQKFTGGRSKKPAYDGEDILHFNNVKNLSIEGVSGAVITYKKGLRIGSFSPRTGNVFDHGNNFFRDFSFAANPGTCIYLQNCSYIKISNLSLDGNNQNMILGGVYGDVGRQLPHYGIFIWNSKTVEINNVYAHHFGLDGISVANKETNSPDSISIINCVFEYNARQGFSWIGGNQVYVKNSKFNHTGKGKFNSPPGAGIDIEAEVGPIKNGVFDSCDFINNTGLGLLALAGDSRECKFTNCNFWGSTNGAIWLNKPGYSFYNCNIYGLMLQGCDADDDGDATKFYECLFEDTIYNGKRTYGNYLLESRNVKRMRFTNCTFISKMKKLVSLSAPDSFTIAERYQLINCLFIIENKNLPPGDFIAITKGVVAINSTFNFKGGEVLQRKYNFGDANPANNPASSGTKILYNGK